MLGILLVFLFYPLFIWILYLIKDKKQIKVSSFNPTISLITVVHNAENLIVDKIKNSLSLSYPSDNYEIIIFSDGSTDNTESKVKPFINKNVHFFSSITHEGKISGMNKAVQSSSGEIIVFSDVDAILEKDAIINLVKYFSNPTIGGVCGQRVISEDNKGLKGAQSSYIGFDSTIKILESQTGSISSNDGKLYAVRRRLFMPIPTPVMDDLYVCLSIVKQNFRFVFEPNAKAYIKIPSRNTAHEIQRRRRIVTGSLTGIYLMRELLNPFHYGIFSIRLTINKIVRRFLPVLLILFFFCSLFLSFYISLIKAMFFLQITFYFLAFCYPLLLQNICRIKIVTKAASLAYYFCLGNYGTLLGLFDLLIGKQIVKWKPLKTDI